METFKQFKNTEYSIGSNGTVTSTVRWRGSSAERQLKPHVVKGYYAVELACGDGRSFCKVHRLVAELFVPNPHGLETVNHRDFNKLNNAFDNLEWLSLSNNVKDAWAQGRCSIGSDRSTAVLNEEDVAEIKMLFVDTQLNNQQLGEAYGVSRATISQVRRLDAWAHVRPDLVFSRESPGEPGARKKLCGEDIPYIRQMYSDGLTLREIGKEFGVNYGTINGIISGRNWKNY